MIHDSGKKIITPYLKEMQRVGKINISIKNVGFRLDLG
jgi:hypothetical protein